MPTLPLSIGLLLAIAGGAMLVWSWHVLGLHGQSLRWPRVPAFVTSATVQEHKYSDGVTHKVEITCEYQVEGQTHRTTRHTDGLSHLDPEEMERLLVANFSVGKPVEVSVNPANPQDAILFIGYPERARMTKQLGLLLICIGVTLALFGTIMVGSQ